MTVKCIKSATQKCPSTDFTGLKALFLNCTLSKSPELSHTDGLINISKAIMEANGIKVEVIRPADYDIAHGVYPDMTNAGSKSVETDAWPWLGKKVMDANILVITSPLWLGQQSSHCTTVIERLYSMSGELNDAGQYAYYGRVGGCLITGNEDGAKHASMGILYSLQHLGYVIPPQADAAWLGGVGPGPSYMDENSGGPETDFTNRNTTFMTYNLMHMAKLLDKKFPEYGNSRHDWDMNNERYEFTNSAYKGKNAPNPEYRS